MPSSSSSLSSSAPWGFKGKTSKHMKEAKKELCINETRKQLLRLFADNGSRWSIRNTKDGIKQRTVSMTDKDTDNGVDTQTWYLCGYWLRNSGLEMLKWCSIILFSELLQEHRKKGESSREQVILTSSTRSGIKIRSILAYASDTVEVSAPPAPCAAPPCELSSHAPVLRDTLVLALSSFANSRA